MSKSIGHGVVAYLYCIFIFIPRKIESLRHRLNPKGGSVEVFADSFNRIQCMALKLGHQKVSKVHFISIVVPCRAEFTKIHHGSVELMKLYLC